MTTALTSSQKMHRYRDKLRAAGLRPIQIWAQDTRSKAFAEEMRRQSLLVSSGPDENSVLDFIEKAADSEGWE